MYMRVKCIKADDTNILVEDALYTVRSGVKKKQLVDNNLAILAKLK